MSDSISGKSVGRARTMTLRVRCSATTVMRGCCGTICTGCPGVAAGTVTGGRRNSSFSVRATTTGSASFSGNKRNSASLL